MITRTPQNLSLVEKASILTEALPWLETYVGKTDPKKSRGVNYLELFYDGTRWWVASAVWQTEDKDHPIPEELLPGAKP